MTPSVPDPPPPPDEQLAAATALIRGRRSIKPGDMDPARPVDRALLTTLLENATWAPTHGLTEPWRFIVHTGNARAELAKALQAIYRRFTPEEAWREDKLAKLGAHPLVAPVVILVGMRCQPGGKIPETEEVAAVACAVQNLHLSASAAGLAGFWSTPPVIYHPEAAGALGFEEGDRCLGVFYLGWPRPGASAPRSTRRPLEEKCRWRDG